MNVKIRPKQSEIEKLKREIREEVRRELLQEEKLQNEIRKYLLDEESRYLQGIDAVFLWGLHVIFGFGAERLKRAYKGVIRVYKQMRDYYEMDGSFPAETKLKEIGVDMDELRKETANEEEVR